MLYHPAKIQSEILELKGAFLRIRKYTEEICKPLEIEDYTVQSIIDISPPKWHLAHTTWFFESFILKAQDKNYQEFHPRYNYIFNSYYNSVGKRVLRKDRGNLSRPTVKEVYAYRRYVDEAIVNLLENTAIEGFELWKDILTLGLQHEQQHQELLWTDIKYILGKNPLYPPYSTDLPWKEEQIDKKDHTWIKIEGGNYHIGFEGEGFCFDNELKRHEVYVDDFEISNQLVTNEAYMEFIEEGGYENFSLWLDEGWAWIQENNIKAPLYWEKMEGKWMQYQLNGLQAIVGNELLKHISYYEANAFAHWKGMRLATEQEWEIASDRFSWGQRWEITRSPYVPYPGFKTASGAIGEYNGKFMVNQITFRGSSVVTSPGHSRATYRNFFHPNLQWQFSGIRLVK
jgi:ergothioneine biosynthesis protein EgtB